MTRDELVELIATDAGIGKPEAQKALRSLTTHIGAALLAGEPMRITGFGTFNAKTQTLRHVRNPRTGEMLSERTALRVGFVASRKLRDRLAPLTNRSQNRKAA